ncbi:uncharacterized protein L199_001677 [Kwoniella botswanensis]|uniref:uncharacterized protein n=1 Tax=Kwoniella botswanensis TaxID=1268659 RepID=UPI00315C6826
MAKRRSGFTLVECPCPGDHISRGRHMMESYGTGKETICYKCMTDYSHSHLFATECTKRGEHNLLTDAVERVTHHTKENVW